MTDHHDDTHDEAPDRTPGVAPHAGEEHEDHLHPERLAMDTDDVIHALDPDRWTPDDPHDEEDYPFIESDVQAPPG
ncbi:MAG: hypothetical protein ACFCVK_14620 [Acidimicrobiales bacterium]